MAKLLAQHGPGKAAKIAKRLGFKKSFVKDAVKRFKVGYSAKTGKPFGMAELDPMGKQLSGWDLINEAIKKL